MSTEHQDERVIEALRSLADDAIPSADLRTRSLAPTRARTRGRRLTLLAAASVVAVALVALAAITFTDRDDGSSVIADGDGRPGGSVAPSNGSVEAEALGRDLLVFGLEEGMSRIIDGERHELESRPVIGAFPDGSGGVVYQELSEWRSILWLPAGAEEPTMLVEDGDEERARLHGVVERDGETTVLFTRRAGDGDRETETLYGHALGTGAETSIVETGGAESGLDAVAARPDGELLLSTCHLQCGISTESSRRSGESMPIVPPGWISGLDVEGDMLAYVRFTFEPEDGMVTDPALIVAAADGHVRHEVPLDHDVDVNAQSVVVDLSPDGETAIVSFVHPAGIPADPPIVVDRLDQGEPRVRVLTTAEGARFLPDASVEGDDDLDAALPVVRAFVAELQQGDLDAAGRQVGDDAVVVSGQPDADSTLRQFREDFAWLLGASSIEWHVSRSAASNPAYELPIVTAVAPAAEEGQQRRAAAFLLGPAAIFEAPLQIQRLPEATVDATPTPGSAIGPGDRVVIDGIPVEGSARAYINGREVTADVDFDRLTTSVEIPTWAAEDGEVVLTLSLATPEEPSALALWYRVDP